LDVATLDGQIFAIGGFDLGSGALVDSVEARRVAGSGKWRDVAPMPTLRANVATAALGGLVYAVGGYPADVDVSDRVEAFSPRSGRWTTRLPLPQPRGAAGAAALGGLLYVAGGLIPLGGDNFEIAKSVVVYDPERNTWRGVAPMPTARDRLRLVAAGRYLYAIGGTDLAGESLSTVERYDPRSNSWRTMNPMLESRAVPGAVATTVGGQGVLVVVGGAVFAADGSFIDDRRTTEVFDLETGRWTMLDALLPTVRGSLGCAVEEEGTIIAIAGATRLGPGPPFISVANVDALSITPRDLREH
jgi:N-acetylneuraminic acid mutarotase